MTRELREELREIDDRVESDGAAALDAEAREQVADGLTADDDRTRSQAVRVLRDLPRDAAAPVQKLQPSIVSLLEAALEDSASDRHERSAEKAARTLTVVGREAPGALADLAPLAERLVSSGSPRLRTAGAALLSPMVVEGLHDIDDKHVDHLVKHVILTDSLTEEFARQVDAITPALIVLSEAAPDHAGRVAALVEDDGVFGGVSFEQYLKAPYEAARQQSTRFLSAVAEQDPGAVELYLLDLVTQLRDEDDQVVLHAGYALAGLGESDVSLLRPVEHVLPAALSHEAPPAVAGVLAALDSIADAEPDWLGTLPLDDVFDLRERESLADEAPIRARVVSVAGRYGATAAPERLDEEFVTFAVETLEAADGPADGFSLVAGLRRGLGAAADARPSTVVPALLDAAVETSVPDEELLRNVEAIASWLQDLNWEEGSPEPEQAVDDDVTTAHLQVNLVRSVLSTSVETSTEALDRCLSVLLSEEEPVRRRLVAGSALVTADLPSPDDEIADRLQSARSRFDLDGDEEGLAAALLVE